MTNLENIKADNVENGRQQPGKTIKDRFNKSKYVIFALASLWIVATSCWEVTQADVNRAQLEYQTINKQLAQAIDSREDIVKIYNTMLAKPVSTSEEQYNKNVSLWQRYDQILNFEEMIKKLWEDKARAKGKLEEYKVACAAQAAPNEPINERKWDFLKE